MNFLDKRIGKQVLNPSTILDEFKGRKVGNWLFVPFRVIFVLPLWLIYEVLTYSTHVVEVVYESVSAYLSYRNLLVHIYRIEEGSEHETEPSSNYW